MKALSEFKSIEKIQPNELAAFEAFEFCKYNAGWESICDLKYDIDQLYLQWSDLTEAQKQEWECEEAFNEFNYRLCKVPYGFILSDGSFVKESVVFPHDKGFMMVFKTSMLQNIDKALFSRKKGRKLSQYIFIDPKELLAIESYLTPTTKHQAYSYARFGAICRFYNNLPSSTADLKEKYGYSSKTTILVYLQKLALKEQLICIPNNFKSFSKKFKQYTKYGILGIISGKVGNKNAVKQKVQS